MDQRVETVLAERVTDRNSTVARARLLADQQLRPLAERRAALAILTRRLEAATRAQLLLCLPPHARKDRRLLPVLSDLVRSSLA